MLPSPSLFSTLIPWVKEISSYLKEVGIPKCGLETEIFFK